jgi:enoyl-CoA hydratase/carnithine racemase
MVEEERVTEPRNDPAAPLLLFEHVTASGHLVAEARLNSAATLNSLSLPMIEILGPALTRWADEPRVVAVLFTGSGDRAFSAGGDIQALYRAIVKNHAAGAVVDDYPFRFFEQEYRLDHQIHTYGKPTVSIGHGVVMGGGLGVFSGARCRIVTEKSRIALPEVTIGLFPDAGATWLLRNMPAHLAVFLGTTGAHINGADALAMGVATHSLAAADRAAVVERLQAIAWRGNPEQDHAALAAALDHLPEAALPPRQIDAVPESLHANGSVLEVAQRVRSLIGRSAWVDAAVETMNRGCPASVGIVVEQLQRAPALTLADCFRLEMVVATHCATHRDFAEGVRALIIDKDNKPEWQFATIETLPHEYVAEHFEPPWRNNPLDDLEETAA